MAVVAHLEHLLVDMWDCDLKGLGSDLNSHRIFARLTAVESGCIVTAVHGDQTISDLFLITAFLAEGILTLRVDQSSNFVTCDIYHTPATTFNLDRGLKYLVKTYAPRYISTSQVLRGDSVELEKATAKRYQ